MYEKSIFKMIPGAPSSSVVNKVMKLLKQSLQPRDK